MPSSSLRISLVYRARDCRCTVLVAGTRSLAVVGTRPGARNWLASAFSEEEVCRRGKWEVWEDFKQERDTITFAA